MRAATSWRRRTPPGPFPTKHCGVGSDGHAPARPGEVPRPGAHEGDARAAPGRVSGIPTLLALKMEIPDQAHRTTVDFDQVVYHTDIDESFFSPARLSRMGQ